MSRPKHPKTDFDTDAEICFWFIFEPRQPQRDFDTDVEICFELELGPNSPKQSVLGNVQAQAGLPLGPRSPKQISSLIPQFDWGNFRQTQTRTDFDTAADIYVGLFSGLRCPVEI